MDLNFYDTRLLLWMGSTLYAFSFLFALGSVMTERTYMRPIFYILLICGFLFQSAGLYFRGLILGVVPLSNILEVLHVISWCTVFLVLIIQLNFRLKLLGFFGSGLATFLSMFGLAIRKFDPHQLSSPIIENPWLEFHAVLGIFSYGAFGLLAITSFMFLLQDHGLTHKRFGGFFGLLPSLKQIDDITRKLQLIGVVALSLSVILGTLTWISATTDVSFFKLIASWTLWFAYSAVLFVKEKRLWPPRKVSWANLILFFIAMIALWPVSH